MSKTIPVKCRISGDEIDKAWVGYTVNGQTNIVDQTARILIPGKLDMLTDRGVAEVHCVWVESDGNYTVDK